MPVWGDRDPEGADFDLDRRADRLIGPGVEGDDVARAVGDEGDTGLGAGREHEQLPREDGKGERRALQGDEHETSLDRVIDLTCRPVPTG